MYPVYASHMLKDKHKMVGDINSLILLVYNEGYYSKLICNCKTMQKNGSYRNRENLQYKKTAARFN